MKQSGHTGDATFNSLTIGKRCKTLLLVIQFLEKVLLDASVSGGDNTAIGFNSLTTNTSGSNNTAIGRESLEANTTGGQGVCSWKKGT